MWDNFEVSVTDEYTVNRVFCSNGLFKISSNEPVTENPNIYSIVHKQKMLLAIDKSLTLLENENIAECRQLSFDATIDCLAITQSGNIIICALSNGNITGVYIKGFPTFQLMINEEDISNDRTFVNIHEVDNEFYINCAKGALYKLSNIDEGYVISQSENDITNNSLLDNVSLECLIKFKYNNYIDNSCLVRKCINNEQLQFFLINCTKDSIHFCNNFRKRNYKINIPSDYNGIKNIYNLEHFIIGLNTNGELFEICPYTKTIKNIPESVHNKMIDNLVIMESNEEFIDLLLLTKSSDKRVIKIVEFPSMKCKYELPMMKNTWLVDQEKTSIQLYYVSGNQRNTDFIQEVEMNILSETQPIERLKKLIQKGHLDEAEEFAKQFTLSVQPINEAKVKKIIVEIKTKQFSIEDLKSKIDELFNLLYKIDNKIFIISLNAIEIPDRQLMETYLKCLFKLIQDLDVDNEYQNTINDINERILRMETLNIIDPFEVNQNWHDFVYQTDLMKTCIHYFKSNLSISCLIWGRHASSIIPFLDKNKIITLLNAIPESTLPSDILQWLRHFTPNVLQTHPEIMTTLVDWSIQKTKKLQSSELWPEIGLDFINQIYEIFEDVKFLLIDINHKCESNMEKLKTIIYALESISVLKVSYDLSLTLDDYIKDSLLETSLSILQRIQINNLKSMVNNFLYPIFMERGLTPAASIVMYIESLINKRKNISTWQERAVECIELLHNEEEKLKCVLLTLKAAPVPWSDTIKPLIKYGASNHQLSKEIFDQYEAQNIKMLRIKYGWDANSTDDPMKLVFRIVKMNLDCLIDDIKELIKAVPNINLTANIYCCYELARQGDIEKSFDYFKSLDNTNKDETAERLINMLIEIFDDDDLRNGNEIKNLLELSKLIHSFTDKSNQHIIKTIHNKFTLKKSFNMNEKVSTLLKSSEKEKILSNGIDVIIKNINKTRVKDKSLIKTIWADIMLLTAALEVENLSGIFILCKRFDNIYLSCSIGLNILKLIDINIYNIQYLIDIVILLIAQQMLMCEKANNELENPAAFVIAYELLYEGLKLKNNVNTYEILELCRLLRIGTKLYNMNIIDSNDKLLIQYEHNLLICIENKNELAISNVVIPKNKRETITSFDVNKIVNNTPESNVKHEIDQVLKCISLAIKLCILLFDLFTIEPYRRLYNNYTTLFNTINIDDVKNEFFTLLNQLIKLKFYSSVFDILQVIKFKQLKENKLFLPASFLTTLNKKIIKFMLLQKEPMITEALAVLLSDEDQMNCINYLLNDLKVNSAGKVNYLTLTEMYYTLKDDKQKVIKIHSERLKFYYMNELCKNDISLRLKSNLEFVSINALMKDLQHKILDINLLEKLSLDFNWNYQEVLISQVITILNMQKLEYDITIDIIGKEKIIVKTSSDKIVELCMVYINEITDIDLFTQKLNRYITEINFYFYELYLCVIEILNYINKLPTKMELWKSILLFLKHKMIIKRRKNPSQSETDWWLKSHADIGVLPKISKYRFPFMPIINIHESLKTLLDDEISVDNCENWFTLIHCSTSLDDQPVAHESIPMHDYFCMSAVKNSTTEYKLICDNNHIDVWHLKPINNAFLQSILCLINHMKDLTNILFLLYFVTNHAPEGIDQVEAAYECYKFALKNKNELIKSDRAKDIVEKIERKYPIIKIQHLLHVYSLTDDTLMQLVECPKDLIHALYMHEIILKQHKPDINKLAGEIADLHNIYLYKLQVQLLHKWLSFSENSLNDDLEETFYDDNTSIVNDNCFEANNDELVVRAHYILGNWEIQQSVQFLISHIFSVDGSVNNRKQLQVFECFTKLINDTNSSNFEIFQQADYLALKCVNNLCELNYNITIKKFNEYDKYEFLKKIWKIHANNALGLEVMAIICLGYNINKPYIWNGILQQMITLNMFEKIKSVIYLLSTKPELLNINGLALAWEYVISQPFKTANNKRSPQQDELLIKSLLLLQSCPVATKINTIDLAEKCICLGCPYLAAILIRFANPEQKETIIKMVLKHKTDALRTDIINLEEYGVMSIITKYVINELEI